MIDINRGVILKNKLLIAMGLSMCTMLAACGGHSDPNVSTVTSVVTETDNVTETSTETSVSASDRAEEFSVSEDLASVTLGKYEQDNNTQNGTEAVEWIVLETKDNMALVISKNILDCKPYNEGYGECTWETSSIRKWLNSDFINSAFSESEQLRIQTSFVPDVNPELTEQVDSNSSETAEAADGESSTDIASEEAEIPEVTGTEDKIFLLSDFELQKYLADDENIEGDEAYAKVSAYAEAQGVWTMTEAIYETRKSDESDNSFSVGCGWWWLRTGGSVSTKALDVDSSGNIRIDGHDVGERHDGIRPAMWITLD